jgi:hypothetical protein
MRNIQNPSAKIFFSWLCTYCTHAVRIVYIVRTFFLYFKIDPLNKFIFEVDQCQWQSWASKNSAKFNCSKCVAYLHSVKLSSVLETRFTGYLEDSGFASTNIGCHVHWGSAPPGATYLQSFYGSLTNMAAYSKQMFMEPARVEDPTAYNSYRSWVQPCWLGICKKFAGT